MSEIAFRTGIAYVSDGKLTYALPNAPISKIIIKKHAGTMSGGASGDYVANTMLKNLKLRYLSKDMEDWNGDAPADEVAYGINALRMFNKHMNGIADVAEFVILDLPDAIPSGSNVELSFQFNPIASINDGDRTAYTGTIDIYYESKDLTPNKIDLRKIIRNKHSVGTKTTDTIYLDGIDKGFMGLALLMYVEDNGTAFTDAEGKVSTFTISKNSEHIWSGTYHDLRAYTQRRTKIAPSAGWAVLPLGLRTFTANQLKIELAISSAHTAMTIHYWIIQVAQVRV